MVDLETIRVMAERVATSEGLHLVDVELKGGNSNALLRVYIDKAAGVSHADCALVSEQLSAMLDVEDLFPGRYVLEVSSPGLDRKLSRREDFQRFTGSLVKIQTFEPIRNNRHWQGRLVAGAAEANIVTLDLNAVKQNSKTRKTGVNTVEIALGNIEKAQLVPEI